MNITIVYPAKAHSAYRIAAQEFEVLSKQVSNVCTQIITDAKYADRASSEAFTVLIGSDAVNSVTAQLYLNGQITDFGIRYGTDDYSIRTAEIDKRRFLFLVGGRPRAAIYAVYRYFELFCGCRWFWDGDRIPSADLPQSDIDLTESPRFDYRGIRYFAHRSLHRFQAEHWSFEDWAKEIDWILKKRLNLFMLRIGMDDIFQKAFPETVSYPKRDEKLPEAGAGYDNRTLFWSLEYRGELRKKILQYAFERDLMHPEDCGTMTHWYSRTPLEFLNKIAPTLLPQSTKSYGNPSGLVWDIRDEENFNRYFKLTETHIKEYGKPEIFHTIGLGERLYSADPEENKRMKLYVYRKIATHIKEHYPNAPLLIASWDLWMRFSPEEVRELVAELDPNQSIIFDYTSDTVKNNNFTKWGVVNKFPWIFGIFSGYEPNSEIRGSYELTNERLKLAKGDPMCRGLILWPELSHGDPFVIEYFAQNAWDKDTPSISEQVDRYCRDRYSADLAEAFSELWQMFMPIVQLAAWCVDRARQQTIYDIFPNIIARTYFKKESADYYRSSASMAFPLKDAAIEILTRLSTLSTKDEMTRRDAYDMARTIIGRYINTAILQVEYLYTAGASVEEMERTMVIGESLLETLTGLLGTHDDYRLSASLAHLRSVTETNPHFEATLKENAECFYCRSYIYENAKYLYLPEMKLLFSEVKKAALGNQPIDKSAIDNGAMTIRKSYYDTPLDAMPLPSATYRECVVRAAGLIGELRL